MKKLAIAAMLVAMGCRGHAKGSGPVTVGGAAAPGEAIERFLGAAKAQDYDGMGLVFGSAQGPARATIAKPELEKREFIMMRCLRHDRLQVGGETVTPTGERVLSAQIWFKDLTATTNFTVVQGPNDRWYVKQFEPDPLQQICAAI